MKYVSKFSLVLFAIIALAACSKKGGNSAAAANGYLGCVPGANGVCTNGTPYYGPGGQWSGSLTVANPALFNQMMMQEGRGGVAMVSPYVGLSIRVTQGQGRFKLSTAMFNRWIPVLQKNGQTYTSGVNGFNIVSQNYYFGGAVPYNGYAGAVLPVPNNGIVAPGVNNAIQIIVTFVDGAQMIANVQLLYANQLVAQGQMSGRPNYGINGGYTYQSAGVPPRYLPANRYY